MTNRLVAKLIWSRQQRFMFYTFLLLLPLTFYVTQPRATHGKTILTICRGNFCKFFFFYCFLFLEGEKIINDLSIFKIVRQVKFALRRRKKKLSKVKVHWKVIKILKAFHDDYKSLQEAEAKSLKLFSILCCQAE